MPPLAHVEVYYASTCTPCRLELPALAQIAEEGALPLSVVILGDVARARDELSGASPKLAALARESDAENERLALRSAGDDDGILPYARSLSADGTMCGSWRGVLSKERIIALLALCKAR